MLGLWTSPGKILAVLIAALCTAPVCAAVWSEFVPPAPSGTWLVSCLKSPGWGPDPDAHVSGNPTLWGYVLRAESRDFALVSTRRANHELYNEPVPYWLTRSLLWFRCGEVEVPHSIWISHREEGASATGSDLGVRPYGPYYVHRLSGDKLACKMLGWAGTRATPADLPSFWNWPKVEVEWNYLLDAKANDGLVQITARNASGRPLEDVDVKLVFYLGPECGMFWHRRGAAEDWSRADADNLGGSVKAVAALAEGMHSGICVAVDDASTIEVVHGSPMHGSRPGLSLIVHCRVQELRPDAAATFRAHVSALLGDAPRLPGHTVMPSNDLRSLSYRAEPYSMPFAGAEASRRPRKFVLDEWLADLGRPKVRGVTQVDVAAADKVEQWVDRYSEINQNLLLLHSAPPRVEEVIEYARRRAFEQIWTSGSAEPYRNLPREARPDGFGEDVDAPLWAYPRDPAKFAGMFGYDISKADRVALVRYYSRLFADSWRRYGEEHAAVIPEAATWFYGQLAYQADRYPLNTDAMCRIFCEELAKVPDLHLIYFYYGIDNGHIENQVRIAKSAGLSHVYMMPMSWFCTNPGVITGNLEAARQGGADGAVLFTADWTQDWQLCEWGLATRTYFPTPDLPAFLLTWDLRGLTDAIRNASSIRIQSASVLTPNSSEALRALPVVLSKRAGPDTNARKKGLLTVYIGAPDLLPKSEAATKAKTTMKKCGSFGLLPDCGYVLPFEGGIWVGGATPRACERAIGLMLEVARMASFGGECTPYPRQTWDGYAYF